MKGSIRFNNDINVEVSVDPSAEAGAKLESAKNLVDGQELGTGGGSDLPAVTSADEGKVLAVNSSGEWAPVTSMMIDNEGTLNVSYNQIKNMCEHNNIPYLISTLSVDDNVFNSMAMCFRFDFEDGAYWVTFKTYNSEITYTAATADAALVISQ